MFLPDRLLTRNFLCAPDTGAGDGELTDAEVDGAGAGAGAATTAVDDNASEPESDGDFGEGVESAVDGTAATDTPGSVAPSLADVWKAHKITGLPDDPQQLVEQLQRTRNLEAESQQMRNALLWQMHNQRQQEAQYQAWQQQQQQTQNKPKPVFELPEYNPDWLQYVYRDEHGNLIAKSGADPTLPQKIEAFAKAREQANIKFLQDPVSILAPHIVPQVQQIVEQQVGQRLAEFQRVAALKDYERENASWVFQNGKNGAITPAAELFNQHYAYAQQLRHPDPIQYAHSQLNAAVYQDAFEQQAQRQNQQTTNKQRDTNFIKNAAKKQPNRAGNVPNGTTKKSKPLPSGAFPRNRLLEQLKNLPDDDFEGI